MTTEQKNTSYYIFRALYFPLQYFIIRCAVLGLAIQPTLLDIYNGFNVKNIVKIALEFLGKLPENVNQEYYFVILANFMPYLFRLAIACLPCALYLFALFSAICYYRAEFMRVMRNNSLTADEVLTLHIGQPKKGKTSKMLYDAVIVAQKIFTELRLEYKIMLPKVGDYYRTNNKAMLKKWNEIKSAYIFWQTHDCIPCLISNIALMYKGQNVLQFTKLHAQGKKRIPPYCLCVVDEFGKIFNVDMGMDKDTAISDFCRLPRHFGDFRITGSEQDPENVYIDSRRSVSQNIHMISQTWVNKPLALLAVYKLIAMAYNSSDNIIPLISSILRFMQKLLKFVGHRRYEYEIQQNVELEKISVANENTVIYTEPFLNCQYDDRCYSEFYPARNLSLDDNVIFETLKLPFTEENKKEYMTQARQRR